MGSRNAETNQGDGGSSSAPPPAPSLDQPRSRAGNTVFKSGPLLISSKGIGWTSWKKRWFILTRTSLVFFRSDPSVIPQKGSEVNLTLGGIDLNNSGSVVVKEDKKLLTVLFPDGRDGRAFTLKAETLDDLHDWKTALENALTQAPSAALVMGQNGIFHNDPADTVEGGFEKWSNRCRVKSFVVGRPILLALEDIDGTPSFLEKALSFIEQYGVKVEGILRQSADVDLVNRRVREYEDGRNEFSSDEDAHLIADCVKHVIRGLPSSPVPASCCNALLEACRADRGGRINAMRAAVAETFPEPNRRLLQRILKMMQIVASHKSENRMSSSAVSACMAPLLLRPLLEGDCELENDFNMGGDGSVQLLQAAAAANHAQAIVITLLEEYDNIFGEFPLLDGSVSPELYTDSEESGSEDDEPTDDDEDSVIRHNLATDSEDEGASSGTISGTSYTGDDQYDNKGSEDSGPEFGSADGGEVFEATQMASSGTQISLSQNDSIQNNDNLQSQCNIHSELSTSECHESLGDVSPSESPMLVEIDQSHSSYSANSTDKINESMHVARRPTVWGRTSARKNLSMESVDYGNEDEVEIQKLELNKIDLQKKIVKEVKENKVLRANLENRKKALQERRLVLQQDVTELQGQLQKERDLRATMEARLNKPLGRSSISPNIDNKTKAELEEISQAEEDVVNLKKKVADLHLQLNQQSKDKYVSVCASCGQPQQREYHSEHQKNQEEDHDTTVAASLRNRSRNSEDGSSKTETEHVRTDEIHSSRKKQLAEKDQMEPTTVSSSASSNSKKSSTKSELTSTQPLHLEQGTSATSTALSKLTTRLNFLKERRTQIVNELQNIENSRGPDSKLLAAPPKMHPR
ncbi:Rho gtpase-activating protein ren1 [Thalictrum thalictroides]|uniref:Rho gtpase-activating protein ren1 n=1 Tax=Thalictrum thalictroides TaxID=46969 RepID=A0A7J6VW79_THATH|nr:Rho gtpase-activating protein ren1 [Thalictrum thalictroides]